MQLTRPEPAARAVAAGVALLAILLGVTGLVVHESRPATAAPSAPDIGVVSGRPSVPSPGTPSRTALSDGPDTLSTHSTKLGAQGSNGAAPARVSVPRLHIAAAPVPTGLASDGRSLALPPSARTVVWWAYGATPGATSGTVLLAGHVSWNGRPGRLGQIGRLRLGDRLTVTRHDGVSVSYAVTGRRRVPKMSLDRLGLFATGGPARLVLVTCGGAFDAARHSYEDNVVVQARPVG